MSCIYFCTPCKPRYQRLVDSIYPSSLGDGVVNSNMQKLTFYAISQPDKLSRISDYIVYRMARDLNRQRYDQVKVSVVAMDQLLQSCHNISSVDQFIDSFFTMMQKLLETNNFELEKVATDSFVNYANIEETSAYNRDYEFFICKFAAMCHSIRKVDSKALRHAGLRGLRGVLWKSASDPMRACIWEMENLKKIIPSILYILQDDDNADEESDSMGGLSFLDHPYAVDGVPSSSKALADQLLRELMAKAPYGLISVLKPVLEHCDLHDKWNPPPTFAIQTFKAIMFSVRDPCFVIQALIHHLETVVNARASVRIGIASVLSSIVSIAGSSIGPSLLGIFNSLLKQLRQSVVFQQSLECPSVIEEKIYQEALINAMGDYANALPDYQKVEIMMFTVGNIPKLADDGEALVPGDDFLQNVLVKTIIKVATKYKTAYLATVFTDKFLNTMTHLALVADPTVRLDTQRIFHTLLDRHGNISVLVQLPYVLDVSELQLTVEKCSRADQMFMRKHILALTSMLYKSVHMVSDDDSQHDHIEANLCTMALLCIEVGYDEVLLELFRLSFALQALAVEPSNGFSASKVVAIHNLVAKYLNLSCQLMAFPSLCQYVQQVIQGRMAFGNQSLNLLHRNEYQVSEGEKRNALRVLEENTCLLFNESDVVEMLKASGFSASDVQRFSTSFYDKNNIASPEVLSKNIDNADGKCGRVSDIRHSLDKSNSCDISIDWSHESVRAHRKSTVYLPEREGKKLLNGSLTIQSLWDFANNPLDTIEQEALRQRRTEKIVTMYRSHPFDELVDEDYKRNETSSLSRTIKKLITGTNESSFSSQLGSGNKPKDIFELKLLPFVS